MPRADAKFVQIMEVKKWSQFYDGARLLALDEDGVIWVCETNRVTYANVWYPLRDQRQLTRDGSDL